MPKCYQLIGVPGSGKTTWAESQDWAHLCVHISTDNWIEVFAKELGKTYSEIFNDFMPAAVKAMAAQVELAAASGRDVIWDQTSTTVASRKRKFDMLPDYEHIAVVFQTPSRIELKKRLDSRPGKTIPDSVLEGMLASFQIPTEEEGFSQVWYAH
jgi:predicted kinase